MGLRNYERCRDYSEAVELLGSRDTKAVCHNTFIRWGTGNHFIEMLYHGNVIIRYYPDETCLFSGGGWFTPTTKERLNLFSYAGVWQRKGEWYVNTGDGKELEWYEGITV